MGSGIVETEGQQRQRLTLPGVLGAITSAPTPASGADAPDTAATNAVTRATIHPTVNGAAAAGRQDGANSIAMQ
jgi:hypothetical protein